MRFKSTIEVRQNLKLTMRERGKIVARREGHNIFVDLGREWLAELISYASYSPDAPFRDDRVKYMGVGIGGTKQKAKAVADAPPITPPYSGTNLQEDTDFTLTTIERPIRIAGSVSAYPGIAGDTWIGIIATADPDTVPTQVTFTRIFTQLEVNYGSFISVPLSEIGLFTSAADPENYKNTFVAYDTFDTLFKTNALDLEVQWTLKF